VLGVVKGGTGAFSFSADNNFVYINGINFGPTYPGGLLNAYGTAGVRERRKLVQDKAAITVQ